jgi:hypothetical protein
MPSDEPSFVVASGELDECGSQLFDGPGWLAGGFFAGSDRLMTPDLRVGPGPEIGLRPVSAEARGAFFGLAGARAGLKAGNVTGDSGRAVVAQSAVCHVLLLPK